MASSKQGKRFGDRGRGRAADCPDCDAHAPWRDRPKARGDKAPRLPRRGPACGTPVPEAAAPRLPAARSPKCLQARLRLRSAGSVSISSSARCNRAAVSGGRRSRSWRNLDAGLREAAGDLALEPGDAFLVLGRKPSGVVDARVQIALHGFADIDVFLGGDGGSRDLGGDRRCRRRLRRTATDSRGGCASCPPATSAPSGCRRHRH